MRIHKLYLLTSGGGLARNQKIQPLDEQYLTNCHDFVKHIFAGPDLCIPFFERGAYVGC